jgi:hypothetical protein
MAEYRVGRTDASEVVEDFDEVRKLGQGFALVDKLEEVNLGRDGVARPTYMNENLPEEHKCRMSELLREFNDCFAWEYIEIPGLNHDLIEDALPIKPGFRPHRKPARNFNPELMDHIKEEVELVFKGKLHQA